MGELARIGSAPTTPAPARRRPALYTDHLPDMPIGAAVPDAQPRGAQWILRELQRLAFLVAVVALIVGFLWTRA